MNIGFLSSLSYHTYHIKRDEIAGMSAQLFTSDYGYPWGNTAELLQHHNLNLLNPQLSVAPVLKDQTDVAAQILKNGNINTINLANHLLLSESITTMTSTLNQAGINTVGIGFNEAQARQPIIYKQDDITIGIIGFTNKKELEQHKDMAVFYVPFGDVEPIKDELQQLKSEVDVLIALVQWGSSRPEPTDTYTQFAHRLIDHGVDIIHGESDHVYLGVENYNGKLIIYDSGDFVEIMLANEKQSIPRSFIYSVELEKTSIKQVTLTPVLMQENQLQLARGQSKIEALNLMQTISKNLSTTVSDEGIITF